MKKKAKIHNEDPIINFRVPRTLKEEIEREAEKQNITTSKYLREVLMHVHDGTYCEKELGRRKQASFLFSKEFIQLVIWLYSLKGDRKVKEDRDQLEKYIIVLKKADEHLPQELNREFDKVLIELLILVKKQTWSYEIYSFIDSHVESKKFNFKILEQTFLDNDKLEAVLMLVSPTNLS